MLAYFSILHLVGFAMPVEHYRPQILKPPLRMTTPAFTADKIDILDLALARLADSARIVLCGAISRYNEAGMLGAGPKNYFSLILHRSRMEGFLVFQFAQRYPEAIAELAKWYAEGRVKNKIDLAVGLENAPKTLIRLFTGANFGKQLLNLADPQ